MKAVVWALLTTIFAICCAMPAQSKDSPATRSAHLKELWRVGGDSENEGEIFGKIYDVSTDVDGNVYILDGQAMEVRMFSHEGAYIRAFGRAGEGPGEFLVPMGLVTTPDNRIGVYQSSPPRIVMFNPNGDSAGDVNFDFEPGHEIQYLANVQCGPDSFVITGLYAQNTGQGLDRMIRTLRFDLNGKYMCELAAMAMHTDFAKPVTSDERQTYVKCSPSGRAYIADSWNYKVVAHNPDCRSRIFVERAFEHHRRSSEELDRIAAYYRHGSGNARLEISKYDPDIGWMGVDGREDLWVLTSGQYSDGSLGRFDVYDADGRLIASVDLATGNTAKTDRYFLRGNRLFVLRHNGGDEKDIEAPGLICYQLPNV
jgi:hypothetical protein